ncbi:C-type lectin-2 [Aphelenchoides avenae]|nr:C-type lectin-2 [Aphelenchus avenae]
MNSDGTNASATQQACAGVSGTLPSIHNMTENEWIAEFYKSHTTRGYWGHVVIGLYNSAGSWDWYDGSDYDFVNWAANEPQDGLRYATFYTGNDADGMFGQWYGDDGSQRWNDFLCQVPSC